MTLNLDRAPLEYSAHEQDIHRAKLEFAHSTGQLTARTFDTFTGDTTLTDSHDIVLVDASGGAVTITLPPAADGYKEYTIKVIDTSSNLVTIDGDGSEEIDGSTSITLTTYDSFTIVSDGTAWWIISQT
jgi:hypothetical protein